MRDAGKPYIAIQLHEWDAKGWGVADIRGALVDRGGLCIRLTKDEAEAKARLWNAEMPPSNVPETRRYREQ